VGTLKVKEQLKFQAHLRMSKSCKSEEKDQRVEEIMNDVTR
jgi:ABC-type multidrug transport system ATPase subunit